VAALDYQAYEALFNSGDDAALVERFFDDDVVFSGGTRGYRGRDQLKAFLDWAHDGVREVMRPQTVLHGDDMLFAEVDMDFHATKERPEFPFGHLYPGDCVTVNFTNQRAVDRASLSVGELTKSGGSSGVNVGFDPEQTVLPGKSRVYKFYAETSSIEAAQFSDFGGDATGNIGLYGAFVVHEKGAWFTDSVTGARTITGVTVDAHVPGQRGYRDDTLFLQDNDPQIGSDFMPYPLKVDGLTLVNYKNAGRRTDDFSGAVATPLLKAYVSDPIRIHVLSTPGSEQPHVFRAGGLSWLRDPYMPGSQEVAEQGLSPYQGIDVHIIDGAGGRAGQTGDFFYGDNRRPFTEGGMWGVLRVLPVPVCGSTAPLRLLDGAACN